jgi:hypothetical protein
MKKTQVTQIISFDRSEKEKKIIYLYKIETKEVTGTLSREETSFFVYVEVRLFLVDVEELSECFS